MPWRWHAHNHHDEYENNQHKSWLDIWSFVFTFCHDQHFLLKLSSSLVCFSVNYQFDAFACSCTLPKIKCKVVVNNQVDLLIILCLSWECTLNLHLVSLNLHLVSLNIWPKIQFKWKKIIEIDVLWAKLPEKFSIQRKFSTQRKFSSIAKYSWKLEPREIWIFSGLNPEKILNPEKSQFHCQNLLEAWIQRKFKFLWVESREIWEILLLRRWRIFKNRKRKKTYFNLLHLCMCLVSDFRIYQPWTIASTLTLIHWHTH